MRRFPGGLLRLCQIAPRRFEMRSAGQLFGNRILPLPNPRVQRRCGLSELSFAVQEIFGLVRRGFAGDT